jgi:hypothetical protein
MCSERCSEICSEMFRGLRLQCKRDGEFSSRKNLGRPRGRPILQFWLRDLLRPRRVCHQARMT